MRPTELETLLANYKKEHDIQVDCFYHLPSVDSSDNLPSGQDGYVVQTTDTGDYYLFDKSWVNLGKLEDERMDQIEQDIDSLKLSTGTPVDLSDYIKKTEAQEVFGDLTEETVIPLTDDEINNILNGGA